MKQSVISLLLAGALGVGVVSVAPAASPSAAIAAPATVHYRDATVDGVRIFPGEGAHPYLRDPPDAELHIIDTGHFALEERLDEMAPLIRSFLDRKVANP